MRLVKFDTVIFQVHRLKFFVVVYLSVSCSICLIHVFIVEYQLF